VSFTENLANCDGSTLVETRECTVPFSVLMAEPFVLTEMTPIYAKVLAINEIGESVLSLEGNGATLVLSYVPSKPFGLEREHSLTTTTEIGLMWTEPTSDGG